MLKATFVENISLNSSFIDPVELSVEIDPFLLFFFFFFFAIEITTSHRSQRERNSFRILMQRFVLTQLCTREPINPAASSTLLEASVRSHFALSRVNFVNWVNSRKYLCLLTTTRAIVKRSHLVPLSSPERARVYSRSITVPFFVSTREFPREIRFPSLRSSIIRFSPPIARQSRESICVGESRAKFRKISRIYDFRFSSFTRGGHRRVSMLDWRKQTRDILGQSKLRHVFFHMDGAYESARMNNLYLHMDVFTHCCCALLVITDVPYTCTDGRMKKIWAAK